MPNQTDAASNSTNKRICPYVRAVAANGVVGVKNVRGEVEQVECWMWIRRKCDLCRSDDRVDLTETV